VHLFMSNYITSFFFILNFLMEHHTPSMNLKLFQLTEPVVNLVDVIVSAIVALSIALVGIYFQRREAKQKEQEISQQQTQFQKQMELEWEKFYKEVEQKKEELTQQRQKLELEIAEFNERFTTPERKVRDWLGSLTFSLEDDLGEGGPYIVGPPIISPENFFGRRPLTEQFYKRVVGPQLMSVSLVGARRSGKTSFLYHISHPDILRAHLKKQHNQIVPVYLNLQANITSPERFYEYLADRTMQAVQNRSEAHSVIPTLSNQIAYDFIEDFFGKLCKYGLRFILLLDEIESLKDNFDEQFFYNLRALASGQEIAWVTTSYIDIHQVDSRTRKNKDILEASPFFNIFSPHFFYLGALNSDEAGQLIKTPAAKVEHIFNDQDVAFIIQLAGRLPFALQACASMMYHFQQEGQTKKVTQEKLCEKFSSAMHRHFEYYWERFTTTEQRLLMRLANDHGLSTQDSLMLSNLEKYGFVEKVDEEYVILGEAFTGWIRRAPQTEGKFDHYT